MKQLKRITVDRIMSWRPCSEWPRERVVAAFEGRPSLTPLEFADLALPADDILWVLLRDEVIPARELRLIACWCAERVLKAERAAGCEPDPRSWAAVRVARRRARGQSTEEELSAARDAAWAAAGGAAGGSAWAAAGGAAGGSAWAAAWEAAVGATRAIRAANDTSWVALWDAEWSATLAHVKRVLRRLDKES